MSPTWRAPFTGCGTALVTPFNRQGELDEAALRRLVRRQIDGGIHFLVPCGTTGESPTLTHDEYIRVIALTVEEAQGRVPVVAGAGGYDTREVIARAHELEGLGVTGLLSVTPYYNKPTQEGLYQHYRAIAEATALPILIYSVAGRTGVNVEPATLARLAELPNIAGVKEASGNVAQMASILNLVPEGFLVLSGDDVLTVPLAALGGHGVISVSSNEAPQAMASLANACMQGDFALARQLHRALQPLFEANFYETNPIPVKAIMAQMGLLEPVWRLPLVPPQAATQAKLDRLAAELPVLQKEGSPAVAR